MKVGKTMNASRGSTGTKVQTERRDWHGLERVRWSEKDFYSNSYLGGFAAC